MTNKEDRLKEITHVLLADCPDCGRMIVYKNRCGKCAGNQWLPAGHLNRFVLFGKGKRI